MRTTLIILALLLPFSAFAGLGSGLVGYWPMDSRDFVTSTSIVDRSGQGDNGTLTNGPTVAIGKVGQALNFDGVNDMVIMGANANLNNLNLTGGLTASAWIYPRSLGVNNRGRIFDKANSTAPTGGWIFNVSNFTATNQLAFQHGGSTVLIRSTAANTITLNQWQHVAATWDGSVTASNIHIYINGAEAAYNAATDGVGLDSDSAEVLKIGNDKSFARTFDGIIDEARVYNRVLTPGEIKAIYNQGAGSHNGSWMGSILRSLFGIF